MSFEDNFFLPFGGKVRSDNRWIILAKKIPWGAIEEIYASLFPTWGNQPNGRRAPWCLQKTEYIKHKVDVRLTRNVVEVFFGGTTRMFILDEEKKSLKFKTLGTFILGVSAFC